MSKKIYLNGDLIEVTDEVYREFYAPVDRERHRAQRHGRCRCPRRAVYRCTGDCLMCEFQLEGNTVSLEAPVKETDIPLKDTLEDFAESIANEVEKKELIQALHAALDLLAPDEREICSLIIEHSERESAEIMGMPRSTFKRRWEKIRTKLQDKLKDFYY